MVNAMLWLAKTVAPWRDLAERYGTWPSVATGYCRWTKTGLRQRRLAERQRAGDTAGELDWSRHLPRSPDPGPCRLGLRGLLARDGRRHQRARPPSGLGSSSGAPLGLARRRRSGQQSQTLGRSRGGFISKLHLRCERGERPIAFVLTAGERHEQTAFRD